jgi:hypothetical protein
MRGIHANYLIFFIFIDICCLAQASTGARVTDGPAELPRLQVQSSLADSPAPGKRWLVKAGDNLQDALDQSQCGDVIALQAGATFAGEFRLPAKLCDDQHWVIIRSSAPDSQLPREGTRLTPCYSGVSGLPARPPLRCSATEVVTAKLVGNTPLNSRGAAIDHYRLVGLELTHPPEIKGDALLGLGMNSHHVIIDRCWIHGSATDDTQRAMALNGSQLAVIDSTITDIHMVNTDTQGIAGWTGTGPLKIVNNFIEGGSSSIGFGGAGSEVTPSDIEIRRNHLFKPPIWKLGSSNFIGVRFNAKVLLESKNSSRVLIEGNIIENAWGGPQGGDGDAIWLGPKNQNNHCPSCEVNDITFRYNILRHAGGALYIFDAPSDAGGVAVQASRYSIHDNVFEDIRAEYAGPGSSRGIMFRILGTRRFLPPRDINIVHNTGSANGGFLQLLTSDDAPAQGLVIRDNLIAAGDPLISGCQGRFAGDVLNACASGSVFENNVGVGGGEYPKSNSRFQKGHDAGKINLTPRHWKDVGLASDVEHGGGDYRVCQGSGNPTPACASASPYRGQGTDGRDPGADASRINELTTDVE